MAEFPPSEVRGQETQVLPGPDVMTRLSGAQVKNMDSIYGKYEEYLPGIMEDLVGLIEDNNEMIERETGHPVYEHFVHRIKDDKSMRGKCRRKGLPETAESALAEIHDAIGLRIITAFRDDIFRNIEFIRTIEDCRIVEEKDYVTQAKPNGYRSYHMILELTVPVEDVHGNCPGHYYAEIQLRTIAMDTWASLEHEMKYKQEIPNSKMLVAELKRCADVLESCDLSMQTIRGLIRADEKK